MRLSQEIVQKLTYYLEVLNKSQAHRLVISTVEMILRRKLGKDYEYLMSLILEKVFQLANSRLLGSIEAMWLKGVLQKYGIYTEKSLKNAFSTLNHELVQEFPLALYELAHCYECGIGVEKNYPLALKYYLLSAKKGLSAAQYSAGTLYKQGLGVTRDEKSAVEFFEQAAMQKYPQTQVAYAKYLEHDESLKRYEMETYERGGSNSKVEIFDDVDTAITSHDTKYAIELYNLAAMKGSSEAIERLAKFYSKKILYCISHEDQIDGQIHYLKGAHLFQKLKYNDSAEFSLMDSTAFTNGMFDDILRKAGNPRSGIIRFLKLNNAIQTYTELLNHDNDSHKRNALKMLGFCYQFGLGVQQNLSSAINYYNIAISLNQFAAEKSWELLWRKHACQKMWRL